MSRWQLMLLAAVLAASGADIAPAAAQAVAPGFERRTTRDNQPPLPAPEFLPEQRPTFELPPAPPPRQPGLASDRSLLVKDIVIEGNTVLPPGELEALVAPYEGARSRWRSCSGSRTRSRWPTSMPATSIPGRPCPTRT